MPLQQELYRTYLLIQDIDPTARLSKFINVIKLIWFDFSYVDMAKLLGDYQYLMKIWTVSYSLLFGIHTFKFLASMASQTAFYRWLSQISKGTGSSRNWSIFPRRSRWYRRRWRRYTNSKTSKKQVDTKNRYHQIFFNDKW